MYTTSLENRFKNISKMIEIKNFYIKKYKIVELELTPSKVDLSKKIPYSKNCYPPSPINFYQHLVPSL